MDNITFKDTRLLGQQPEQKSNNKNSFINLVRQMQPGSVINAEIIDILDNQRAIYRTYFGDIIGPNPLEFNRGERIKIEMLDKNLAQNAVELSVNDPENNQLFKIVFNERNRSNNQLSTNGVEYVSSNISKAFTASNNMYYAKVTYLDSSSSNFSILHHLLKEEKLLKDSKSSFTFSIVDQYDPDDICTLEGKVVDSNDNKQVLVRTNMAMISVDDLELPIGSKFYIKIETINNQKVSNNLLSLIISFAQNLSQSIKTLKKINFIKIIGLKKSTSEKDLGQAAEEFSSVDQLGKNDSSIFKKLSRQYNYLSRLANWQFFENRYNGQLFLIPFFVGNKISKYSVRVIVNKKYYRQFCIDCYFDHLGKVQFEGQITFATNNFEPIEFNLKIRFEDDVPEFYAYIIRSIFDDNIKKISINGQLTILSEII